MKSLEFLFVAMSIISLWLSAVAYVRFVRKSAKDRCKFRVGTLVCLLPAASLAFYPLIGIWAIIISALLVIIIAVMLTYAIWEYVEWKAQFNGLEFIKSAGNCFCFFSVTIMFALLSVGLCALEISNVMMGKLYPIIIFSVLVVGYGVYIVYNMLRFIKHHYDIRRNPRREDGTYNIL